MTPNRPLAVVTDGSSGIGFELARQLAARGFDLIVTAEDHDRLHEAAARIRAEGARVETAVADLRRFEEAERFYTATRVMSRPVAVAALNAGSGHGGAFLETDLLDELEIIDLNVRATVHLANRFLCDMVYEGEGRVLMTSPPAPAAPGRFQAVHDASRSFLRSFARVLRAELRGTGVSVTALTPGPAEAASAPRAGTDGVRPGRQREDDPARMTERCLDTLFSDEDETAAGPARAEARQLVG
ncbi:SDR family NAD(P)-dependent oxidoreductase [Streptomyces populi]